MALQMHHDGGDDLRVFVADHLGHQRRLHQVQRLDAIVLTGALVDVFEQRAGALLPQRLHQHRADMVGREQIDGAELLAVGVEFLQRLRHLLLGDLRHVGHRRTELLDLLGRQELEDLCGAVLVEAHDQGRAAFHVRQCLTHGDSSSS